MRVRADGALPPPGALLMQDGKEAGEMKSGLGDRGLALIRLDRLEAVPGEPFLADGIKVRLLDDGAEP